MIEKVTGEDVAAGAAGFAPVVVKTAAELLDESPEEAEVRLTEAGAEHEESLKTSMSETLPGAARERLLHGEWAADATDPDAE